MNPEIKAKWLEALRSGKYAQGKECLRLASNEYCCLGVLCDVYDPTGWELKGEWYFNDRRLMLPRQVRDHAVISINQQDKLMNMNDDGQSFAEIADYIEREL